MATYSGVTFNGLDNLSDTVYYQTAPGAGLIGQAGGIFYGQGWVRIDSQVAGGPRSIVSTRFGATTGVTVGYYVRLVNNATQIEAQCFWTAGTVVTAPLYTLLPGDYGKALHFGFEHTGAEFFLIIKGARVGAGVAAPGYTVPSLGMWLGRRANGTGEGATGIITVCGLAGGNYAVTTQELADSYTAGLAAGDVVAIPGKTDNLWSPKLDGSAVAPLPDRVGSANCTRVGAPTYVTRIRPA